MFRELKGEEGPPGIIYRIHKAWNEHGVEAFWTGQKNISQFHNHAQNVQAVVLAGHTSCKLDGLYD